MRIPRRASASSVPSFPLRLWSLTRASAQTPNSDLPQRLFRPFPLRDVLGERHNKSRHILGSWNERNVVAHPDQAAVLAPILLLDLKLFSFSFEQLGDEIPVVFAVIFVGNVEKSELTEFLLGVTQHFLLRRVGGKEAAIQIGQR